MPKFDIPKAITPPSPSSMISLPRKYLIPDAPQVFYHKLNSDINPELDDSYVSKKRLELTGKRIPLNEYGGYISKKRYEFYPKKSTKNKNYFPLKEQEYKLPINIIDSYSSRDRYELKSKKLPKHENYFLLKEYVYKLPSKTDLYVSKKRFREIPMKLSLNKNSLITKVFYKEHDPILLPVIEILTLKNEPIKIPKLQMNKIKKIPEEDMNDSENGSDRDLLKKENPSSMSSNEKGNPNQSAIAKPINRVFYHKKLKSSIPLIRNQLFQSKTFRNKNPTKSRNDHCNISINNTDNSINSSSDTTRKNNFNKTMNYFKPKTLRKNISPEFSLEFSFGVAPKDDFKNRKIKNIPAFPQSDRSSIITTKQTALAPFAEKYLDQGDNEFLSDFKIYQTKTKNGVRSSNQNDNIKYIYIVKSGKILEFYRDDKKLSKLTNKKLLNHYDNINRIFRKLSNGDINNPEVTLLYPEDQVLDNSPNIEHYFKSNEYTIRVVYNKNGFVNLVEKILKKPGLFGKPKTIFYERSKNVRYGDLSVEELYKMSHLFDKYQDNFSEPLFNLHFNANFIEKMEFKNFRNNITIYYGNSDTNKYIRNFTVKDKVYYNNDILKKTYKTIGYIFRPLKMTDLENPIFYLHDMTI